MWQDRRKKSKAFAPTFLRAKVRGFTLIELIVAISVSLLLIGVSIPIFVREAGGKPVEKEAQSVASFVDRARNYAFHPEDASANYYGIQISQDGKKITIVKNISTATPTASATLSPQPSVVPTSEELILVNSNITQQGKIIMFKAFSGEPDFGEPADNTLEVKMDKDPSKKAFVTINSTGNINVNITSTPTSTS
jgi:prepilin-type N-terminal cleavage/methylation domain-containing protein